MSNATGEVVATRSRSGREFAYRLNAEDRCFVPPPPRMGRLVGTPVANAVKSSRVSVTEDDGADCLAREGLFSLVFDPKVNDARIGLVGVVVEVALSGGGIGGSVDLFLLFVIDPGRRDFELNGFFTPSPENRPPLDDEVVLEVGRTAALPSGLRALVIGLLLPSFDGLLRDMDRLMRRSNLSMSSLLPVVAVVALSEFPFVVVPLFPAAAGVVLVGMLGSNKFTQLV